MGKVNKVKEVKAITSPLQLRLEEFHSSIDCFKMNPSNQLLQEVEDAWVCIYNILEEELIEYIEDERQNQLDWERS